jgi:recombination protein RecR
MKVKDPVQTLIRAFKALPQVGDKTALKYVQAIVKGRHDEARQLAQALLDVASQIRECLLCGNFTTNELCEICADPSRDRTTLCVVEDLEDLIALEAAGGFRGRYHILGGLVNPVRGLGPKDLRLQALHERVQGELSKELILALPPTMEGDLTARYIMDLLKDRPLIISSMALGIPYGAQITYLDSKTLKTALERRTGMAFKDFNLKE